MPVRKLKDFLDKEKIKYVSIVHSPAFTAQEVAASAHITGKELAKTVIVRMDGALAMAVVSANQHVDFAALADATGAEKVELAGEDEFKEKFPDCEAGAMPPFGNLYGMKVFADESLLRDKEITFNAGSHRELIRIAWEDFDRLVQPRLMRLAITKHVTEAA